MLNSNCFIGAVDVAQLVVWSLLTLEDCGLNYYDSNSIFPYVMKQKKNKNKKTSNFIKEPEN